MSDTPLLDALSALAARPAVSRFHMPGHKGLQYESPFDGVLPIDYTELPHTGNLYDGDGPIARAEELCAQWYGMDGCFFLTCGATQGLKAALRFFCRAGGSVVLDRNCHKSVLDGCALLDLRPRYVVPDYLSRWGVSGGLSPDTLAAALRETGAPAAVVTSPTYYGCCLDLQPLADAAHSCGAALIVDAAHGSHLRACGIEDPAHAGADMVVFSAHKTLCALGQGAYLVFRGLDGVSRDELRAATALFGTTSPSYVIMASLDAARSRMEQDAARWRETARRAGELRQRIEAFTPFLCPDLGDPCRLTVCTDRAGLCGFAAAEKLFELGVEPEMQDEGRVVFILTPQDRDEDWARLTDALLSLGRGRTAAEPVPCPPPPLPPAVLTPSQALSSPKTLRPLGQSVGRLAGQSLAPYPPGVAAVVMGESLTKFCVEYLLKKGYNRDTYIHIIP